MLINLGGGNWRVSIINVPGWVGVAFLVQQNYGPLYTSKSYSTEIMSIQYQIILYYLDNSILRLIKFNQGISIRI